jgi:hypothetical protein
MNYNIIQESRIGGREINQDRAAWLATGDAVLMVVADGMGGHLQGEVAAQLAVDTVCQRFGREARPRLADPARFLDDALRHAHESIVRHAAACRIATHAAPRTTCIACIVQDGQASWAHAGDSRLYLVHDRGETHQRVLHTRDHSVVQRMVDDGMIDGPKRPPGIRCATACSVAWAAPRSRGSTFPIRFRAPARRPDRAVHRRRLVAAGRRAGHRAGALAPHQHGAQSARRRRACRRAGRRQPDPDRHALGSARSRRHLRSRCAPAEFDAQALPQISDDDIDRAVADIRGRLPFAPPEHPDDPARNEPAHAAQLRPLDHHPQLHPPRRRQRAGGVRQHPGAVHRQRRRAVPGLPAGKGSGWVTAEYGMLPRATNTRTDREAARGKQSGRTQEIQRLIGRSLRAVTDLKARSANARSRSTATCCRPTAAPAAPRSPAPAWRCTTRCPGWWPPASWPRHPMRELVAAVSVGIVGGVPVLDLDYEEDSACDTDMNVVMTASAASSKCRARPKANPSRAPNSTPARTGRGRHRRHRGGAEVGAGDTVKKLVLASGNAGKLREFGQLLAPFDFEVLPQSPSTCPRPTNRTSPSSRTPSPRRAMPRA